jgi:hypothetical protein
VLLPAHTLIFRDHTHAFLTLLVALAVAATFVASVVPLLT